jgi:hypothetical protein
LNTFIEFYENALLHTHTIMPYDISHPFIKRLYLQWKRTIAVHKSYVVKNKFHQERRMDDWTNELRGIDTDFRNRIENAIRDLEREETERHLMEQQEIEMRKAIAREKREKRRLEKKSTPPAVGMRVSRRLYKGS